ncbi:hypothetical protein [Pantanalinema sp. GBBB05]|uniref:hypothetical protein n=1 Tax=Pantanalinema sp. GBBB05 TaxID=2604139 RepID=UPI001DFAAEE3|nr:hypothetical protein [Pantanalinema sp. GBBB05]
MAEKSLSDVQAEVQRSFAAYTIEIEPHENIYLMVGDGIRELLRRQQAERRFRVQLEFKPQDFWMGAFWQRKEKVQHVWICLVPMLPIHFRWLVGGDR